MERNRRKGNRIPGYNYSKAGAYFLTICTLDRKPILSEICVGTGLPDCPNHPNLMLSAYGKIAEKYVKQLDEFYHHISVDKYIIMPDHVHLLVRISYETGQSGTPVPTEKISKNSEISKFVSTFKRFCNREYGINIWQNRYYDHVVRNQQDYNEIWEYIENNPRKWMIMHAKDQDE